jgi:hypothetical protein
MRYLILSLVLQGCVSANMLHAPNRNLIANEYAPENEKQLPGKIKYSLAGADFVVSNRRKDAYKQMHNACGGAYKIVSESTRNQDTTYVGWGMTADTEYNYITFKCE